MGDGTQTPGDQDQQADGRLGRSGPGDGRVRPIHRRPARDNGLHAVLSADGDVETARTPLRTLDQNFFRIDLTNSKLRSKMRIVGKGMT